MTATTTAAKAMLKCMGLTDNTAVEIVDVDGQGLSTIEDFAQMEKHGIYMMFKLMSCHGHGVTVGTGVKA